MNTIGKTLVILNFLFAIIIGVFLVFTFAVQTQWKAAHADLTKQLEVMQASRITTQKAMQSVLNDNQALTAKINELGQSLSDEKGRRDVLQVEYDLKVAELDSKLNDGVSSQKELGKSSQRLKDEIAVLEKQIDARQQQIIKLEGDVKKYAVEAIGNQSRARALQIRNEGLLEDLRVTTQKLALLQSGVNPDTIAIRNPNEPNPPAVQVNGRIELVDSKDGSLVQISLGSDHGVSRNNTLDVYRTTPEAKYLGMIRIVESYPRKSVARLVATNAAMRSQLRADDLVTSKITK